MGETRRFQTPSHPHPEREVRPVAVARVAQQLGADARTAIAQNLRKLAKLIPGPQTILAT